jgi:hypothetical protein
LFVIFDESKFVYIALNSRHESLKISFNLLSPFRSLPKALQTGPAGGKFVSKFFIGRKDHEVI